MKNQSETEHIRALIQEGADQLDRGETVEGDELFRRWEAKHIRSERESDQNLHRVRDLLRESEES